MKDHTTHHDDCGCMRQRLIDEICAMLRAEQERVTAIAARRKGDQAYSMQVRANAFAAAEAMVKEMLP